MFELLRRVILKNSRNISSHSVKIPKYPEFNIDFLCDPKNTEKLAYNISNRKGVGNINLVHQLNSRLKEISHTDPEYETTKTLFYEQLRNLPNQTHADVIHYIEPKLMKHIGEEKSFSFNPREFHEISKRLHLIRTEHLGNVSGQRSYFIMGELAELEHALINFTLNNLLNRKFKLISVPDIINRNIIEGCGMNTRGSRTQVYSLDPSLHKNDLCLSGTSEIALAAYFANKVINENELPLKVASVSRCYRAETSSIAEERGIYRVHQFTKVEMFVVSTPEKSEELLEELRVIEEENFSSLGLHLRTLDMPPHELGAQAYRKYDIEAWLPGRKLFGEISSCSNCTDYQSRRLGIKYKGNDDTYFVHTLNGTACAIPRMLIALIETYQNDNGTISIPLVLQKYMQNKVKIVRQKQIPELQLIKNKK